MGNFIILANARTGSTSLEYVLNSNPDLEILHEPFHSNHTKWYPKHRDYSKYVNSLETLDEALEEIFAEYTGFKTLQYQLPQGLYLHLLARPGLKIIHLIRKDLVMSEVSGLVAEQTHVWQKEDLQKKSLPNKLKPLDIARMKLDIAYSRELDEVFADFLSQNKPSEHISLVYEQLFSEDLDQNRARLAEICDFLGVAVPPDSAIEKYMSPSQAKLANRQLYKLIPNKSEIEQEFGVSLSF